MIVSHFYHFGNKHILLLLLFGLFCLLGTLGEPSFLHSFSLFEHFAYAPKSGEGRNSGNDAEHRVRHTNRHYAHCNTENQKSPPTFHPEIVFALYNKRMKKAYNKKRNQAYNKAFIINLTEYSIEINHNRQ